MHTRPLAKSERPKLTHDSAVSEPLTVEEEGGGGEGEQRVNGPREGPNVDQREMSDDDGLLLLGDHVVVKQ